MKLKYYTGSQVIDILYSCLDYMQAYEVIKKLAVEPSAEVREVVRCKDCKYGHQYANDKVHCSLGNDMYAYRPNDYCSYGERREDAT